MLYGRLDDLRRKSSTHLARVLRNTGGTPQARSQRDAGSSMYPEQLAQLDAGEPNLCFGRLDLADGDRQLHRPDRHLRRRRRLRAAADRLARPRGPRRSTWPPPRPRTGSCRRRHIRTDRRTVTGLDDEVLDLTAPPAHRARVTLTGEAPCWRRSPPAAPAGCATSSPPSRPSRTASSAPTSPACSWCRAARAPARPPSRCTAPRTCSTPTAHTWPAAAC